MKRLLHHASAVVCAISVVLGLGASQLAHAGPAGDPLLQNDSLTPSINGSSSGGGSQSSSRVSARPKNCLRVDEDFSPGGNCSLSLHNHSEPPCWYHHGDGYGPEQVKCYQCKPKPGFIGGKGVYVVPGTWTETDCPDGFPARSGQGTPNSSQ